ARAAAGTPLACPAGCPPPHAPILHPRLRQLGSAQPSRPSTQAPSSLPASPARDPPPQRHGQPPPPLLPCRHQPKSSRPPQAAVTLPPAAPQLHRPPPTP